MAMLMAYSPLPLDASWARLCTASLVVFIKAARLSSKLPCSKVAGVISQSVRVRLTTNMMLAPGDSGGGRNGGGEGGGG